MSESSDRIGTYAENLARHQRCLTETLGDLGVTPHDYALFTVVHYGIRLPPSHLPVWAKDDVYHPFGPVDESDTRAALADCFEKGWLRVVDESALAEIKAELREREILGPIYHFPQVDRVDFTPAGAELWRLIHARLPKAAERPPAAVRPPFAYTDVVREKTAHYFRTRAAAAVAAEQMRDEEGRVRVSEPAPTGPWRAHWWQRFPQGYRIDVDEVRKWEGCSSRGGEQCYFFLDVERADPLRLQDALDRRNVTLAEWAVLKLVSHYPNRFEPYALAHQAEDSGRAFGRPISVDEYREGLDACLRYGWLRVLDRAAIDEVRAMLRDDPTVLAVPRTAELRPTDSGLDFDPEGSGRIVPVPRPDDHRTGEVDFTRIGAALYQAISAAWLGADWEDGFQVSNGYYREEHRYCETEEGFRDVVPEYLAEGKVVGSVRISPIGPWCVYWWERFPSGFRMELEIGERTHPEIALVLR